MSTQAQINANRANAQQRIGPNSATGNLVQEMTQSYWLMQRAIRLQNGCFSEIDPLADSPKQLALYLCYQTTHNRAFYKALNELQRLREQKRKAERDEAALSQRADDSRFGFVSQERKQAEQKLAAKRRETLEKRQQDAENRAQEIHEARVWLIGAQARRHETETTIAKFF